MSGNQKHAFFPYVLALEFIIIIIIIDFFSVIMTM